MAGVEKRRKQERRQARTRATKVSDEERVRLLNETAAEAERAIRCRCPSPEHLMGIGPIVPAYWCVPEARRKMLEIAAKGAPDPMYGALLIDTGATKSCIDDEVALELGLDTVGYSESLGNGGVVRRRMVNAVLLIPNQHKGAAVLADSFAAVPGLRRTFRDHAAPMWNDKRIDVHGIMGRNILRHAVFHYDGRAGSYILYLDQGTMAVLPDEKAQRLTGVRSPKKPT